MANLEEIFKKYDDIISLDRSRYEQLIKDNYLMIKESFIEFYGEDKRQEIEEKFNKIYLVIPPVDISRLAWALKEELDIYLKEKYGFGFYDYPTAATTEVKAFYNERYEIEQRMQPYKELSEKYSLAGQKIANQINKEKDTEIINYINRILIDELHYSEDMLVTLDNPNKYSWFEAFLQIDNIVSKNERFKKTYMVSSVFYSLRNMGIQIPKMDWENKNAIEMTEIDCENAWKQYNQIMLDANIRKFIPTTDIIKKIIRETQINKNQKAALTSQMIYEQLYGIGRTSLDLLGFTGVSYSDFTLLGSDEDYLIKAGQSITTGSVVRIDPYELKQEHRPINSTLRFLIHEINHALESGYELTQYNTYLIRSGWDFKDERDIGTHRQKCNIPLHLEEAYVRNNELLNEVINEFISMEVFEKFKSRTNIEIQEESCLYSNAFFALDEFYKTYKEEIIQSRQTGNMEILYERVGEQNFIELANLLRDISIQLYTDNFNYKKATENKEKENEDKKLLDSYEARRNTILGNMHTYSQNSHRSRGIVNIYGLIILITIILSLIVLCFR